MPNFKKNKNAYMMKPKGMGQQAYKMIGGKDPKKKKSTKHKFGIDPNKLAKGIRDFHIGAAGFIGPGGAVKGLKSLGNIKNLSSAAKQAKAVFKPKVEAQLATIKMPKRNFISAVKQGISAGKKLFKGFSNAPKQYMKEYKVGGKLYGHYTKSGKLTNKYVPVVGKPGKTVKVPKKSKTKQVSYANPRISMTAEQRRKAGY